MARRGRVVLWWYRKKANRGKGEGKSRGIDAVRRSWPGEADVSLKTVVLAEKAAQAVHRALRPQRGILFYG